MSSLQELITDLKAAGANENTVRLAMNCYELGKADEREACALICEDTWVEPGDLQVERCTEAAEKIRARGQS